MANMKDIDLIIPNLGEAEETEIIEITVKKGDKINQNDPLVVLESEKAAMEVPSDFNGVIKEITVKEGDSVKEGMVFGVIEIADDQGAEKPEKNNDFNEEENELAIAENKLSSTESIKNEKIDFSGLNAGPAVRKIARELAIDLNNISGTGKNSMITKEDLKNFIHTGLQNNKDSYADLEILKKYGKYEIEEQSKIRKLGAKNLSNAWTTIPHVTHHEDVNISFLERLREKLNKESNTKITPLAPIIFLIIKALKEYPVFNSSLIEEGKIMIKQYINIGVAVDTDEGLVVPVIQNADELDIAEIAEKITDLSNKAKNKKLLQRDLEGATFTVSSLGPLGGTGFSPIINPPEVAIIGISRAKISLAMSDGKIHEEKILPISMSYDHRVINGADAGRFMNFLRNAAEEIV